ncbi:hypothetical protein V5O48_015959, partial [Marasmius crinis-equi]
RLQNDLNASHDKIKVFGFALLAATGVAAQKAIIAGTIKGTDIQARSDITIEVDRPQLVLMPPILGLHQRDSLPNNVRLQYGGHDALPPADIVNGNA